MLYVLKEYGEEGHLIKDHIRNSRCKLYKEKKCKNHRNFASAGRCRPYRSGARDPTRQQEPNYQGNQEHSMKQPSFSQPRKLRLRTRGETKNLEVEKEHRALHSRFMKATQTTRPRLIMKLITILASQQEENGFQPTTEPRRICRCVEDKKAA